MTFLQSLKEEKERDVVPADCHESPSVECVSWLLHSNGNNNAVTE